MKKTALVLAAALIATSAASFAAPISIDNHLQQGKGFYLGGQFGFSVVYEDPDNQIESPYNPDWALGPLFGSDGFGGFGGGINLGYQFNRHVALEAGMQGSSGGTDESLTSGVDQYSLKINTTVLSPYLAVKGILSAGNRVTFYGKAGVAAVYIKSSGKLCELGKCGPVPNLQSSSINPAGYAALGMGIYATHHVEFNMEQSAYIVPQTGLFFGYTTVGMNYHF